jgi:hypothetical protein
MNKPSKQSQKLGKITLFTHLIISSFTLFIVIPGLEIYNAMMRAKYFTGGPLSILSCPEPDNFWNECETMPGFIFHHIYLSLTYFFNYKFHAIFIPAILILFLLLFLSHKYLPNFTKKLKRKRIYILSIILYGILFALSVFILYKITES